MTIIEAIRAFDRFPESARPRDLPRFPGVSDDLLWPLMLAGAVLVLGDDRLAECACARDLWACVAEFRGQLSDGELAEIDWEYATSQVIAGYMLHGQSLARAAEAN